MNTVRVLLIGDANAIPMLESVRAGLLEQFRITRKPTLSEGLEALQQKPFALVVLDLSLPDASATESIAKTLRMAPTLPVIALVNEGQTTMATQAMRLGVNDYVMKGCRCDSLVRTMQYALERKQLIDARDAGQQQMTEERTQLVAHLSHEVRNALACIHQFGNILRDGLAGPVLDEQTEYLGIMLQNASRIRTVLDSLLETNPVGISEGANGISPLSEMAN